MESGNALDATGMIRTDPAPGSGEVPGDVFRIEARRSRPYRADELVGVAAIAARLGVGTTIVRDCDADTQRFLSQLRNSGWSGLGRQ